MSPAAPAEVLLVAAPFGPLYQPSLGIGLLKASAPRIRVRVVYLTIPFAELVGRELYVQIADGTPSPSLLCGDWIFSGVNALAEDDEAFLDLVAREARTPPGFVEQLRAVRRRAAAFVEQEAARIVAAAPRVVGFTSTFQQHAASLALARRVKELAPGTVTLVGGANVEGAMGQALLRAFPFVDLVVSGEGEPSFAPLCERLLAGSADSLEGLPGVVSRDVANAPGRVLAMDALPLPDLDAFFEQWAASPISREASPRLVLETSRGCWWGQKHHCTFCGLNGDSMAFRAKSSARAVDEILELSRRHGVMDVLMTDDILSPVHLREAMPRLAALQPGLSLFYEVKANLTREQLVTLRDAGVTELQPGIESLSDAVLNLMRKGVGALQNVQLLKWCSELGIHPWWNLIWGFPQEPPAEYARMAELVPLLTHLPPPDAAGPLRIDRFSPCHEEAEAMGFVGLRPHPAYRHVYGLPEEELVDLAYYFVAEHRDGRDVASYTAPLAEAIARWQRAHEGSALAYTDDGERLLVADYRPVARRAATVLRGMPRELYLACDAARSLPELARALGRGRDDLEREASGLVSDGLMLRDGDRLLALATSSV